MDLCLRAARRWGHHSGDSMDDVISSLITDDLYASSAEARTLYHRLMAKSCEVVPTVLCRVCRRVGVEEGEDVCGPRCREIFTDEAAFAAHRSDAMTTQVRNAIARKLDLDHPLPRIAAAVQMELERVQAIAEGYALFSCPITRREAEMLERGFGEGLNIRAVGRALGIGSRTVRQFIRYNLRDK